MGAGLLPLDAVPLAHGIGGAKDLPVSPGLAIAGAVAALVVSFTVLAVAWREPRYDAATTGRAAPGLLAGPSTPRPGPSCGGSWGCCCCSTPR